MADKIVRADYDEEAGTSTVTLSTSWGTFTHTLTIQEEDKDIQNPWDGCTFAHYLCMIDKMRAKARAFHERAKAIRSAANIYFTAEANRDEPMVGYGYVRLFMEKQAGYAERDAKKYDAVAAKMRDNYHDYVEDTLSTRRKVRNRK